VKDNRLSRNACDRAAWKGPADMLRNTARGVIGLVLTAAAMWLADRIIEQIFGPDTATSA
jgi:hypothetical protein